MNPDKRAWLLFFFAAIAFYLYGIGALPFVGPDEPRYAQVAREMLLRGDIVTPTLGGHTWFEKPALLYWMVAAAFAVFGISEWAARLGPACAGLLSVLVVYWIGRRVERAIEHERAAEANETTESDEPRTLGFWSAVALASSAGLIVFSRAVSFDVIVTMTTTVALACFFASELERDEKLRRWLHAGFYAFVGASLLAKGLIGIVIPFGVVVAYHLLQRRWPERRLLASLLWGLPLAFIVAALWYGPVIWRNGWNFVDEFFIQHHFARYVSNKYRHPGPFYYYLPAILILSLPWPPFLLSAVAGARRWNWRGSDALGRFRIFTLAWLIVPLAFFSVSGSKLPGYILPTLPAAALLIGERLSRVVQGKGKALLIRLTGLLLLLLACGGMFYALRTRYTYTACAALVLAPLFIAGIVSLVAAHMRRLCLLTTAFAMFLCIALAINCVGPAITRRESTRELLQQASARGFARTPVWGFYVIERTSEFYANERVTRDGAGEVVRLEGAVPVLEATRKSGGTILVFVPLDGLRQLTDYPALDVEIIGDNGTVALVVVKEKKANP
ncbi:MAG TPA: glycosyltransferase family 39 protein [Pyrinomonadaceae bacterium]|jgi:4-amino-4-deoxy-L-arabinose transferase-like glycosyltransferase